MSAGGPRVWITGGSSGIGAALALELARSGCRVAITARSEDRLAAIAGRAPNIRALPGDVTDPNRMREIVDTLVEEWGGLDIAVLNAGTYRPMSIDNLTADDVRELFEVNVMGIFHCIAACLPSMRRARSGRLALMSSVTAFAGFPLAAAYGSTKAYIAGMGESLRAELADTGVGVSVIFPGFVQTELTDQNAFDMPWIIPADQAAEIIAKGLRAGDAEIAVPRKPFLAARAFAALPGWFRRRALVRLARRRRNDPS